MQEINLEEEEEKKEKEEESIVITPPSSLDCDLNGKIESESESSLTENNNNEKIISSSQSLIDSIKSIKSTNDAQLLILNQWMQSYSWGEMFDRERFATPMSLNLARERVVRNISTLQTNYFLILTIATLYSVLTTPNLLLFSIVMSALSFYTLVYKSSAIVFNEGKIVIDRREKIIILSLLSIIGSIAFAPTFTNFLWTMSFFSAFVFLHSLFWVNRAFENPFDLTLN